MGRNRSSNPNFLTKKHEKSQNNPYHKSFKIPTFPSPGDLQELFPSSVHLVSVLSSSLYRFNFIRCTQKVIRSRFLSRLIENNLTNIEKQLHEKIDPYPYPLKQGLRGDPGIIKPRPGSKNSRHSKLERPICVDIFSKKNA